MSSSSRPWRGLLGDGRGPRGRLVAVGIALLASVLLPLAGPLLVRAFVDGAIGHRSTTFLTGVAAAYLAVAVGGQGAAILTAYLASKLSWTFTNDLRERLAGHALGLDLAFHARFTAGEMIERVDGDIIGLGEFLSQFVVQAVGGGLLLVGTIVLVLIADAWVGAALVLLVVIGAVSIGRSQRLVVPHATAQRETTARQFGVIEEELVAAEDLRANGAGRFGVNRYLSAASLVFGADVAWARTGGAVIAGTNLLFAVGTAVVVGLGIVLHAQGAVSIGTVVLLLQYSQMVRQPVEQIVGQAKQLQQAGAAVARVTELLAERPRITESPRPRRLVPAPGVGAAIELRDVTFAYRDGEPVLHHVDLSIGPGRSLGLVGRTGSGKSTVGRLVCRLYDPQHGSVRLAGLDLREVALADVRSQVRMVTQDVQLFSTTVRDNVCLFDRRVPDGGVVAALDQVGLGDWLAGLDDGLDTLLGPGALGLSAGEAQLLAFARVFLADPGVIVLDEASSRLDAATEGLVSTATDRLLSGRTAIVIAHRLSSLDRVDDIAVVHDGRVVEHGPRAELAADPSSHFGHLLRSAGLAA